MTKEQFELRRAAHIVFDRLWRQIDHPHLRTPRNLAYFWLRVQMGLTREQCHFAAMTDDQVVQAIRLCRNTTPKGIVCWYFNQRRAKKAFGRAAA